MSYSFFHSDQEEIVDTFFEDIETMKTGTNQWFFAEVIEIDHINNRCIVIDQNGTHYPDTRFPLLEGKGIHFILSPKLGSRCLVKVHGESEKDCYITHCEEIESVEINVDHFYLTVSSELSYEGEELYQHFNNSNTIVEDRYYLECEKLQIKNRLLNIDPDKQKISFGDDVPALRTNTTLDKLSDILDKLSILCDIVGGINVIGTSSIDPSTTQVKTDPLKRQIEAIKKSLDECKSEKIIGGFE